MVNHRPSRWMARMAIFSASSRSPFLVSYPRPKHPHTSRERTALMAQRWEKIPLNGYPWALPALVPWTPIPHCSLPSDKSLRSCRPFPFPPQGPFALQHHLFHVDAVGDAFPYAAAAYSFSPFTNTPGPVSRRHIHILDHVCSLCLGYGMRTSRHAQTFGRINPHGRLRGAARPIPSFQVIQSMYREHSNQDPFGVSHPSWRRRSFKLTATQVRPSTIRACTPPTRADAESRCPHSSIALTARAYFVIASG